MTRTRFAPSPTGYLHIGGVRTALFCWLYARQHGGQFILRIDDTDQERNVEQALSPILDGLRWLGIDWDEGPDIGGPHAPYYQSERADRHRAAVEQLLAGGHAYRDYATPEELHAERDLAMAEKRTFVYSRQFMAETRADQARFEAQGRQSVVRLKMPREGKLVLDDLVRGRVEFDWACEQDHVIQRADGTCLYHLANVVDDYDFEITHVIRAEEHLSNTPRQIFMIQALGYPLPLYAHLPFVAEPGSKNKLSKRKLDKYLKNRNFAELVNHGRKIAEAIGHPTDSDSFNPVIVDFYKTVGYLPDAIINYLALLGWSLDDKTEYFTREELIENFSLERVNKAPASFDPKKLWSFQERHFQLLPIEKKIQMILPFLEKAKWIPHKNYSSVENKEDLSTSEQIVINRVRSVVKDAGDRIKVAGDILDYEYFFSSDENYVLDLDLLKKHIRNREDAERLRDLREQIRKYGIKSLDHLRQAFAQLSSTTSQTTMINLPSMNAPEMEISSLAEKIESGEVQVDELENSIKDELIEKAIKLRDIIHIVRVAITGSTVGLGLFNTIAILGIKNSINRIDRALRESGFPELASHPMMSAILECPVALHEAIDFSNPAKPILLHEGDFNIEYPSNSITGKGKLELCLSPKADIKFAIETGFSTSMPPLGEIKLDIPNIGVSFPAILTSSHISSNLSVNQIEGVPNGKISFGDTKDIKYVIFHVTDFHDYVGHPVRDDIGTSVWAGRLNLLAPDWQITIDAVSNLRERREYSAKHGGASVTHTGKLERKDGNSIKIEDCDEIINMLQFFLSFVRGRWVAPLIPMGFNRQGTCVWQDWTLRRIGRYPIFGSWFPVHDIKYVESLFPRFFERWMDPLWQEFLRPAIGTYLEGNKQGFLDNTIIFAKILLEMIADFVLVEQTRQLHATPTEAAESERICQLFQIIPIPIEIPDQLTNFHRYAETEQLTNGLEVIMRIRNASIHHNHEGRRILSNLSKYKNAFYDISMLSLWYSELCLLWLLGYEGRYQSRIHSKWVGETEEVPWEKPFMFSDEKQIIS